MLQRVRYSSILRRPGVVRSREFRTTNLRPTESKLMIVQSGPWRRELRRHLALFATWSNKLHTERGSFYIERGVFLCAFIVRKLMENRKITDEVRDRPFHCQAFQPFQPLSGDVTNFFGIMDPAKEYDMESSETLAISAYDLMSEIMHSYVFIPMLDEKEVWTGFLVNSYRHRDRRLLQIQRSQFESALTHVIDDRVGYIEVEKHPDGTKVIAKVRSQRPPQDGGS